MCGTLWQTWLQVFYGMSEVEMYFVFYRCCIEEGSESSLWNEE